MSFLYPYNAFFGVFFLILIFYSKKYLFTHLEFFQKKRGYNINILDLIIAFFLTIALMYPQTTYKKDFIIKKNYSLYDNKKHYNILILDVSLSMKDDLYFDSEIADAKDLIYKSNENDYFMIVAFEGDYDIIQPFTNNHLLLLKKLNSLKPNMITDYGGSMLRDSVVSIINSFKYLNPNIYIFSDGSKNDNSSTTKEKLKNLAKNLNIKYYAYGRNENNDFYLNIFHFNKPKHNTFYIEKKEKISYFYKKIDTKILYILLILLFIKILKVRFENRLNVI